MSQQRTANHTDETGSPGPVAQGTAPCDAHLGKGAVGLLCLGSLLPFADALFV